MSTSSGQASGCGILMTWGFVFAVIMVIFASWHACGACKSADDGGNSHQGITNQGSEDYGGSEDDGGSGSGRVYMLLDYRLIHVGMSRSQVVKYLGSDGEPDPYSATGRIYNNPDGGYITVKYDGDTVVDKEQAGL